MDSENYCPTAINAANTKAENNLEAFKHIIKPCFHEILKQGFELFDRNQS